MNEGEHGEVDAIRLLRAIVDQAMQENGFKDVQGAVGISVVPATAPAAVAGMDLSTPRYNAARERESGMTRATVRKVRGSRGRTEILVA